MISNHVSFFSPLNDFKCVLIGVLKFSCVLDCVCVCVTMFKHLWKKRPKRARPITNLRWNPPIWCQPRNMNGSKWFLCGFDSAFLWVRDRKLLLDVFSASGVFMAEVGETRLGPKRVGASLWEELQQVFRSLQFTDVYSSWCILYLRNWEFILPVVNGANTLSIFLHCC